MKLSDYKLLLISIGLIGVLIIASPAIGAFLTLPSGEQFSELYLLGPEHMAENYPYNIAVGKDYQVYLGVGNHLGASAYYTVYVKLRNQTDLLPNATTGTPSPIQPLYEYRFFVPEGKNRETPLTFSVTNTSTSNSQSLIEQLTLNGANFKVNKSSSWNPNSTSYFYQLVFELWLYNEIANANQYHNRYVGLQLNLTTIG